MSQTFCPYFSYTAFKVSLMIIGLVTSEAPMSLWAKHIETRFANHLFELSALDTVIDEPQLADQQHLSREKIESSKCIIVREETAVEAKSELAPTIYLAQK